MAAIEVTAKRGTRELTVAYDFGENLKDAIEKFGEDVVLTNAIQAMKISLQALIRRAFDKGATDEEIAAQAAAWKPGVAAQRQTDPVAAVLSRWQTLSADKKAELLKLLKAPQVNETLG